MKQPLFPDHGIFRTTRAPTVLWGPADTGRGEAARYRGRIIAHVENETFESSDGWDYAIFYGRLLGNVTIRKTRAEAIAWVEANAEALYRGEVVA